MVVLFVSFYGRAKLARYGAGVKGLSTAAKAVQMRSGKVPGTTINSSAALRRCLPRDWHGEHQIAQSLRRLRYGSKSRSWHMLKESLV